MQTEGVGEVDGLSLPLGSDAPGLSQLTHIIPTPTWVHRSALICEKLTIDAT